jgi:hypothetical protein
MQHDGSRESSEAEVAIFNVQTFKRIIEKKAAAATTNKMLHVSCNVCDDQIRYMR